MMNEKTIDAVARAIDGALEMYGYAIGESREAAIAAILAYKAAEPKMDDAWAENAKLRNALEIACRRGCDHCADDIRDARRIDNAQRA
jgi:hypothetical protein